MRNRPTSFFVLATALALSACSGSSSPSASASAHPASASANPSFSFIAGCVPGCLPPGGTAAPREIPAGPYKTQYFLDGMLAMNFDGGWTELEDSTNALAFETRTPAPWLLFVFMDPYPVANHTRVQGIERTPEALVAWMQTDPALIATPGPAATVGDGIPALTVDLEIPTTAIKDTPDCPEICTNYIGFENGPDEHGLLLGERTRIYFAPVTYGGVEHLLVVSVEVVDLADFDAVLPVAQQIIDTFRMPVEPA